MCEPFRTIQDNYDLDSDSDSTTPTTPKTKTKTKNSWGLVIIGLIFGILGFYFFYIYT
jgi:hypothetical protein